MWFKKKSLVDGFYAVANKFTAPCFVFLPLGIETCVLENKQICTKKLFKKYIPNF
jgi:hypothetical protein